MSAGDKAITVTMPPPRVESGGRMTLECLLIPWFPLACHPRAYWQWSCAESATRTLGTTPNGGWGLVGASGAHQFISSSRMPSVPDSALSTVGAAAYLQQAVHLSTQVEWAVKWRASGSGNSGRAADAISWLQHQSSWHLALYSQQMLCNGDNGARRVQRARELHPPPPPPTPKQAIGPPASLQVVRLAERRQYDLFIDPQWFASTPPSGKQASSANLTDTSWQLVSVATGQTWLLVVPPTCAFAVALNLDSSGLQWQSSGRVPQRTTLAQAWLQAVHPTRPLSRKDEAHLLYARALASNRWYFTLRNRFSFQSAREDNASYYLSHVYPSLPGEFYLREVIKSVQLSSLTERFYAFHLAWAQDRLGIHDQDIWNLLSRRPGNASPASGEATPAPGAWHSRASALRERGASQATWVAWLSAWRKASGQTVEVWEKQVYDHVLSVAPGRAGWLEVLNEMLAWVVLGQRYAADRRDRCRRQPKAAAYTQTTTTQDILVCHDMHCEGGSQRHVDAQLHAVLDSLADHLDCPPNKCQGHGHAFPGLSSPPSPPGQESPGLTPKSSTLQAGSDETRNILQALARMPPEIKRPRTRDARALRLRFLTYAEMACLLALRQSSCCQHGLPPHQMEDWDQWGNSLDGRHPGMRGDDCESVATSVLMLWLRFAQLFDRHRTRWLQDKPTLWLLGLVAHHYRACLTVGSILHEPSAPLVQKRQTSRQKDGGGYETSHQDEEKDLQGGDTQWHPGRHRARLRQRASQVTSHVYLTVLDRHWMQQQQQAQAPLPDTAVSAMAATLRPGLMEATNYGYTYANGRVAQDLVACPHLAMFFPDRQLPSARPKDSKGQLPSLYTLFIHWPLEHLFVYKAAWKETLDYDGYVSSNTLFDAQALQEMGQGEWACRGNASGRYAPRTQDLLGSDRPENDAPAPLPRNTQPRVSLTAVLPALTRREQLLYTSAAARMRPMSLPNEPVESKQTPWSFSASSPRFVAKRQTSRQDTLQLFARPEDWAAGKDYLMAWLEEQDLAHHLQWITGAQDMQMARINIWRR